MRQIKSFDELPKKKRPPEYMWDNPEELEDWFDRVFDINKKEENPTEFNILIDDIEG